MLKLTHSFCRSWGLKSQNVCFDCKRYSYFTGKRKECRSESSIKITSILNSVQLASHSTSYKVNKKKNNTKKQKINTVEIKISEIMSDPLQPSVNIVSHGGDFDISDVDVTTLNSNDTGSSSTMDYSKCCVPLHFRIWEVLKWKRENDTPFKFKIVSYNVLAQLLLTAHPYLYTECSPYNLKWEVRASKLYEEITRLDPDIFCLQEVQESHLDSFYAAFKNIGYRGLYKKKTGNFYDGCAIYYKESKFNLVDHINVEYYQPELPVLNRNNVGLMVKLVPKSSPWSQFVVATTHLLYNPKRTDIRLAQTQVFLSEIDRFAFYANGIETGYLPIILTGDLNSLPDSPVIRLLDKGSVRVEQYRDQDSDWRKLGITDHCQHLSVVIERERGNTQADHSKLRLYNTEYSHSQAPGELQLSYDHEAYFNTRCLSYPLQLTSVYDRFKSDGRIEATTHQDAWCTVDYIYYSKNNLSLLERLRLPTSAECEVLGCLPNDVYGSDHLALAAVFQLQTCKSVSKH